MKSHKYYPGLENTQIKTCIFSGASLSKETDIASKLSWAAGGVKIQTSAKFQYLL